MNAAKSRIKRSGHETPSTVASKFSTPTVSPMNCNCHFFAEAEGKLRRSLEQAHYENKVRTYYDLYLKIDMQIKGINSACVKVIEREVRVKSLLEEIRGVNIRVGEQYRGREGREEWEERENEGKNMGNLVEREKKELGYVMQKYFATLTEAKNYNKILKDIVKKGEKLERIMLISLRVKEETKKTRKLVEENSLHLSNIQEEIKEINHRLKEVESKRKELSIRENELQNKKLLTKETEYLLGYNEDLLYPLLCKTSKYSEMLNQKAENIKNRKNLIASLREKIDLSQKSITEKKSKLSSLSEFLQTVHARIQMDDESLCKINSLIQSKESASHQSEQDLYSRFSLLFELCTSTL
jgi:hypothetical protein